MKKKYISKSIWAAGFLGAPYYSGNGYMVADYEKAKQIVNKLISDGRDIDYVEMGLDGDWQSNSCEIFNNEDGFMEYYSWGGSSWATPIIIVYFNDAPSETYEVYSHNQN